MTRCDVVIAPGDRVFINGNEIGRVQDLTITKSAKDPTLLVLEMNPDSIVYGDIPKSTIEALVHADDDYTDHVNIDRAIQKAKARQHGVPLQAAPAPVAVPAAPVRKRTAVERDMPMEAAEKTLAVDACSAGVGGGETCSRPYGHNGSHRS